MQNKVLGVKREIFIIVSLLHLLVDFICVASVMRAYLHISQYSTKFFIVFIYNFIAFLTQPLFGYLIDKAKDKTLYRPVMLFSGAVLIVGALIALAARRNIPSLVIASILLGFGNSCFHVLGGKEALTYSSKSTPGGIFVSLGALGVGLGIMCKGFYDGVTFILLAPILIFVLCLLYSNRCKYVDRELEDKLIDDRQINSNLKSNSLTTTIVCLVIICLAIAMRSFLGAYVNHNDKIDNYEGLILLLSVSAFLGKALGGIIEDNLGPYILIAISGALGILSACQQNIILLDYVFIFSTNLLMPFTLNFVRKFFPKKEGFAFGLAAAFLVPGYYLAQFFKINNLVNMYAAAILVVITIGMLIACVYLKKIKKNV